MCARGVGALSSWVRASFRVAFVPPGCRIWVLCGSRGPVTPYPTPTPHPRVQMLFALFMDRGDSLLLEEYSYPVVTESLAQPKGLAAIPVPIDAHGIIPELLEQVWAEAR